jgi:hypothetical protein
MCCLSFVNFVLLVEIGSCMLIIIVSCKKWKWASIINGNLPSYLRNERTKARTNDRLTRRMHERTKEQTKARANNQLNGRTNEGTNEQSAKLTYEQTKARTTERLNGQNIWPLSINRRTDHTNNRKSTNSPYWCIDLPTKPPSFPHPQASRPTERPNEGMFSRYRSIHRPVTANQRTYQPTKPYTPPPPSQRESSL